MQDHDKLWIVLPTKIWSKLFNLAIDAKMSVNEYLQTIIEQEAEDLGETASEDAPRNDRC